jgi:hypothetical protein
MKATFRTPNSTVALGFGFGLAALGIVLAFVSRFVSNAAYFTEPPAVSP